MHIKNKKNLLPMALISQLNCARVWCDTSISSSLVFINVYFVYSGFYDSKEPCVQEYLGHSHLGEELACRRERNNIYDPYAVAVLKSDVIVSHIPRAISAACYAFLG